MGETLTLVLRIAGLLIAAAGIVIIFSARRIVNKRGLAEKRPEDPNLPDSISMEDRAKLRYDGALLDIKLRGLLVAAPGFILILIAFA